MDKFLKGVLKGVIKEMLKTNMYIMTIEMLIFLAFMDGYHLAVNLIDINNVIRKTRSDKGILTNKLFESNPKVLTEPIKKKYCATTSNTAFNKSPATLILLDVSI